MAATCLSLRPSSSSSLVAAHHTRILEIPAKRVVSLSSPPLLSSIQLRHSRNRIGTSIVSAIADTEAIAEDEDMNDYTFNFEFHNRNDEFPAPDSKGRSRPCELYVCNLPRSFDIPELMEMFKPFGTVSSVEISRNPETGVSRGCGYVTIDSKETAKAAITALDGSDVGGREMRVRFSVQMNPKRRNTPALNSTPFKNLIYESPYKLYVGNLSWNVQPEELRNRFTQFGNVTSCRVLHDRKGGKSRAYGFLSFSSVKERNAAKSLNNTEFRGRLMVVRDGTEKE
ncbi:hypothetical protein UlMin_021809 [Ulmus minor]